MKIYQVEHGKAHLGVTTLQSIPADVAGNHLVVIVGDDVNRRYTGSTKSALNEVNRKINDDIRIESLTE